MTHLTESQLDDHLIGDLNTDASAHLTACKHCQQRINAAGAPFASFREVSIAWAERRSSTMPLLPAAKTSGSTRRLVWATAAVAALAIGVAIPAVRHSATTTHVSQPVTMETAEEDQTAQVARDNEMLSDIDHELSASTSSPANYGLQVTAESEQHRTNVSTVQN